MSSPGCRRTVTAAVTLLLMLLHTHGVGAVPVHDASKDPPQTCQECPAAPTAAPAATKGIPVTKVQFTSPKDLHVQQCAGIANVHAHVSLHRVLPHRMRSSSAQDAWLLMPMQAGMAGRTRDGKLLTPIGLTSPLGQGTSPLFSPGLGSVADALWGLQHRLERALAATPPAVRHCTAGQLTGVAS